MDDDERVEVSVWSYLDEERGWATSGSVTYERVEFEQRHQDAGAWSMTLPEGLQSKTIKPGRLITTKLRDELLTWTVAPLATARNDDGDLTVTVGGFDALSMLGWSTAWPDPGKVLTEQPTQGNVRGTADQVIHELVTRNFRDRDGHALVADEPDLVGATVRSRPRFDNLLTEVLRVAVRGGIGVRLGLRPDGPRATRARLALSFYVPQDRALRVQLAATDGSLATWELTEEPPTATRAIVGGSGEGAGQVLRVVTTPDSEAQAARWGGHREVFVDGPETFDVEPLVDAGEDALAEGAAKTTLSMEAQEPAGTKAFRAFRVGDIVTGIPYPGVRIPDVVQAIKVSHEGDSLDVTPIFGDPDEGDPDTYTAALIRALRRDFAASKINRKRGAS